MIDEKDRTILEELQKDSRRSTKALAEDLDMPRATVHERIRRMHEKGIIKRFTVVPDYSKLDESTTAFILASYVPNSSMSQREVGERIAVIDGVHDVYLISGEYDILIKVRGSSMEQIGTLVIDRIRQLDGVGRTLTSSCFSTIKESP